MMTMGETVIIAAYDPAWPQRFEALAARALAALSPLAAEIEHVGSTSVPGLSAKPVIDLDVVVDPADVGEAIERLSTIGYAHKGDGGIPGREAFRWPAGEQRHHLYVCRADAPAFREHIAFRDFLRANPDALQEYDQLKRMLAKRHGGDRLAYQAAKPISSTRS